MILLDAAHAPNLDALLLGALALSAATGQGFELVGPGKRAGQGVTPLHVTALRAAAALCGAEVKGDTVASQRLRFVPSHEPRAGEFLVDTGAATGRPSPESVTPLLTMLLPALARAEGDSFVRFLGANATPHAPSAFWLRETLAPMLGSLGMSAAVEIERWGWYPDGGGETTLLVEGGWRAAPGALDWMERGDVVGLWVLAALSSRMEERVAQGMIGALERALARDPIQPMTVEVARVRSPGPGSGLFLSLQCEQVSAGFEAITHRGMQPPEVADDAATTLSHFFWGDSAFEPELARAMMIPLALAGRPARFTTPELSASLSVLEALIPQFLPVTVALSNHPAGGLVEIKPR